MGDDAVTLPLDRSQTLPAPVAAPIRRFGDYELISEIARGGMGVVYRARQVSLNRIVAVKMILAGALAGEEDVQRFRNEAEAAALLDHPGIVAIHEIGTEEGQQFFSMQLIEGTSLSKMISEGPVPPRRAAEIVRDVAAAVEYAHARGIVHRDLKPANILLDGQGQPKVTDFGLAKRTATGGMTATGQVLGTPEYMAPEQASGRTDVSHAADVYALGGVLYALLTGQPPFRGVSPLDTIMQVLEHTAVRPRDRNPTAPRDLEAICLKCLEKEPRHRYATAEEVRQDLQRYLDGESISTSSSNLFERVARTLQRGKYDGDLAGLSVILKWIGVIVFLAEVGIVAHAWNGPPYPTRYAVVIRLLEFSAFGLVLFAYRSRWSFSARLADRQMWSTWIAFVVSAFLTIVPIYQLTDPERPVEVLAIYPTIAILSGFMWFVLGGSYWGGCYAIGVWFFLASLVMSYFLLFSPAVFGAMWMIALWITAARLQRLGQEGSSSHLSASHRF